MELYHNKLICNHIVNFNIKIFKVNRNIEDICKVSFIQRDTKINSILYLALMTVILLKDWY